MEQPDNFAASAKIAASQERMPDYMHLGFVRNLVVDIPSQRLKVDFADGRQLVFVVSTAAVGANSREGSFGTPTGWHVICKKIGAGEPPGRVFVARVPTKRIAQPIVEARSSGEDLVITRILWLDGLEEGVNKGDGVDSKSRYIYIHGTHEEGLIGRPASRGCIRMTSQDVIRLFDLVEAGTRVLIVA